MHVTSQGSAQRGGLYLANKVSLKVFYTVVRFLNPDLLIRYFGSKAKSGDGNLLCRYKGRTAVGFKTCGWPPVQLH